MLSHEQKPLIGLDIGSGSVKLVELSGRSPEFELEGIGVSAVEDEESDEAFEHAISSVLEGGSLDATRVATSVCGPNVAVRSFRFPQLSPRELEGAVWYEGSQVIAFDLQGGKLVGDHAHRPTGGVGLAGLAPHDEELRRCLVLTAGTERTPVPRGGRGARRKVHGAIRPVR